MKRLKRARSLCLAACLAAWASGCASMSRMPAEADPRGGIDQCTFAGLGKCIARTARETKRDGQNGRFTRHWFRMSYIGRACYREHGAFAGYLVETLIALPHYTAIAVGNSIAGAASPFVDPAPPPSRRRTHSVNDPHDSTADPGPAGVHSPAADGRE